MLKMMSQLQQCFHIKGVVTYQNVPRVNLRSCEMTKVQKQKIFAKQRPFTCDILIE